MATPVDLEKLRLSILESEVKEELIVREVSDEDILTDDLMEDQLRLINYHMAKPTEAWLRSLVFCGSSCKEEVERYYLDTSIRFLLSVDQNMLITLRHIIFVASESDMYEALKAVDAEIYEWPDCVMFDGEDVGECVGCFWHAESAIIINLAAINNTTAELVDESEGDGCYSEACEIKADGVYVTLLHELRHLGLENPFLDEDEYPIAEAAEDAVEDWAREMYETALYMPPQKNKRMLETVFSDVLRQKDKAKFNACCQKVWGNHNSFFYTRSNEEIQEFLSLYLGEPVELVRVGRHKQLQCGYPYWEFVYKRKGAEGE